MTRKFPFIAGLCLMVTATAIGRSEITDVVVGASSVQEASYVRGDINSLSNEQRTLLQNKYRYWRSQSSAVVKAPL